MSEQTVQLNPAKPRSMPVNRLMLLAMILVTALPLSILGYKLYQMAWENAWREIREKHQLLAQNLAAPLSVYINDQHTALGMISDFIEYNLEQQQGSLEDWSQEQRDFLNKLLTRGDGLRSITVVDMHGHTRISTDKIASLSESSKMFASEKCYLFTRSKGKWIVSGIKASPLNGEPALIISQPVRNSDGQMMYVLMGELRIDLIEKLRKQIKFGEMGHSAIVDNFGHVIAHPNPAWMKEMRDLSEWPIVQNMINGKTGVTEFYSPFIKANMVAGYASVPELNWGIMVPQPKPEIERVVNRMLMIQLGWGIFGLLLAIALGVALTRWITRPLKRLNTTAKDMIEHGIEGRWPDLPGRAPREINELNHSFGELVSGLQLSRMQILSLNRGLQTRVDDATRKLKEANANLEHLASVDYLTKLPNRRAFEQHMSNALQRRRVEDQFLCLMLIDVDNFKQVNDTYGHAAGDSVLVQVASVLSAYARHGDLAARYAGDEFVVLMPCGSEIGHKRADDLLQKFRTEAFMFDGKELAVTVSIGLVSMDDLSGVDMNDLFRRVDSVLYKAKDEGRNCLVEEKF